ncbi:hypothetical protein PIB30_046182 [Stylosanthes scabra]|uniref:Uncharacterized protein n=1 Tax=Stylosanthes scabra TaxID=79078 RepID=A0ABU6XE82_9FABA|nr:hypothetical protein [Stylosanthes scabra]
MSVNTTGFILIIALVQFSSISDLIGHEDMPKFKCGECPYVYVQVFQTLAGKVRNGSGKRECEEREDRDEKLESQIQSLCVCTKGACAKNGERKLEEQERRNLEHFASTPRRPEQ